MNNEELQNSLNLKEIVARKLFDYINETNRPLSLYDNFSLNVHNCALQFKDPNKMIML
jgi:hypothetical protein